MTSPKGLGLAVVLLVASTASGWAASVPAVKVSKANRVADCATPGRLTAYLRSRNPNLDQRFSKIAIEYMRHGEKLGLRWDYTFFQMLLETGHLTFRGDRGRRGDVSPSQNNFAGLGATGRGAPGESFPDVSTGVLAHLQHVLVYAGETVDDPVADRTRKVQEWGILRSMQSRAKGTVTFAHLATKWAPGADYVAGIRALAKRFHEDFCNIPDPNPEWVAEARGITVKPAVADTLVEKRVKGAELARQAIEVGKAEGDNRKKGLGLGGFARSAMPAVPAPSYNILNPNSSLSSETTAPSPADAKPPVTMAAAAGSMVQVPPSRSPSADTSPGGLASKGGCRVWTASYGGQKALIIRVPSDKGTDYTVLDVNEGAETREAEAYIAAYAKGGAIAGEFPNQLQALDKAFELCPEG
jgi:hypothetical protein